MRAVFRKGRRRRAAEQRAAVAVGRECDNDDELPVREPASARAVLRAGDAHEAAAPEPRRARRALAVRGHVEPERAATATVRRPEPRLVAPLAGCAVHSTDAHTIVRVRVGVYCTYCTTYMYLKNQTFARLRF